MAGLKTTIAALAALAMGWAGPTTAQVARVEPWTTLRSTTPLPHPEETGRQKVGDVELHYAVYGKGKPLVMLHPGLGNSEYWANQVGPLSQFYQVILIDLRGHGRSTGSDRPLSYELMAEDVLGVMRKIGVGKAAVIGWGDGGIVALDLAMRHPGRVTKLILFGATYSVAGQQPGVDQTPTFIQYVHKTAEDYQRLSPQPAAFDTRFGQLEALWATQPAYTPAQLGDIKVPTSVMIAEHDEWVRLEHAEELADLIPGARFVVMPNVSHFAPWQAPKQFNDAVRLLLDY